MYFKKRVDVKKRKAEKKGIDMKLSSVMDFKPKV
jgi:hypothetical protein